MKDFLRTFFAVLLAGAILMAIGFSWWRSDRAAEREIQRRALIADHTTQQLEEATNLAEAARLAPASERRKSKAQLQSIVAEIVSRIQAHPLDYPDEIHQRVYALQASISDL